MESAINVFDCIKKKLFLNKMLSATGSECFIYINAQSIETSEWNE